MIGRDTILQKRVQDVIGREKRNRQAMFPHRRYETAWEWLSVFGTRPSVDNGCATYHASTERRTILGELAMERL